VGTPFGGIKGYGWPYPDPDHFVVSRGYPGDNPL